MADTRTGGLTADLPARTARRARPAAQERSGSSDTSLSLSAIRPSSGREPAFIFCIALLRCTFTVASASPRRDPAIADSIPARTCVHEFSLGYSGYEGRIDGDLELLRR
jgi:hypothetical protein